MRVTLFSYLFKEKNDCDLYVNIHKTQYYLVHSVIDIDHVLAYCSLYLRIPY